MDDGAGDYYLDSSEDDYDSDSDSDWDIGEHKKDKQTLVKQTAAQKQQVDQQPQQQQQPQQVAISGTDKPPKPPKHEGNEKTQAVSNFQRRLLRCNSTSTVKVQNTMSKPNQNATIEVIANELHKTIFRSEGAPARVFGTGFDLARFNDPMYTSAVALDFSDSDSDSENEADLVLVEEKIQEIDLENYNPNDSRGLRGDKASVDKPEKNYRGVLEDFNCNRVRAHALPPPPAVRPTAGMVREYLKEMLVTAQCSEECNIICLIYLRRLLECAGNPHGLTAYNWKVAMMSALLLASKVWDDLSMVNEDFSCFLPFSLDQINKWEVEFLQCLKYNVRVKASEYATVYFDLRKRAQCAGYETLPDKELDVHQAVKLEALSTTMERRTKQMYSYDSISTKLSNLPDQTKGIPPNRLKRSCSDAGPKKSNSCRFIVD